LITRAEWREQLQWPASCDDGVSHLTKYSDDFVGVEVYPWSGGKRLVSVMCETGAYNQGEILFLEKEAATSNFELISFPQFKLIKDEPMAFANSAQFVDIDQAGYYQFTDSLLWGNIVVDMIKGTIRNDTFYRGGGGCGVSTLYSLIDFDAQVISLRTQSSCEENHIAISDWKNQSLSEYSKWPVLR
jgi:hypothetical protein